MHSFIKIQSNDKILCFTDCDEDISYEGEIYRSGGFFTPNVIISRNELGEDNFTVSGCFNNDIILEGFLEIFSLTNNEKIVLKSGWIGEVKMSGEKFTATINSLSSKTKNIIGKCYSSSCRAAFADQYCKIDKEKYSFSGFVEEVGDANSFIDKNRQEPGGYFNQGILEFFSGENIGKKFQVIMFYETKIYIEEDIKIKKGDQYKITSGCDKAFDTCISKFSNAINFRGEPFIPNRHKLAL